MHGDLSICQDTITLHKFNRDGRCNSCSCGIGPGVEDISRLDKIEGSVA
jgi:hypothetical protein